MEHGISGELSSRPTRSAANSSTAANPGLFLLEQSAHIFDVLYGLLCDDYCHRHLPGCLSFFWIALRMLRRSPSVAPPVTPSAGIRQFGSRAGGC